ncbi:MAG: YfhO family protein [Lachnospiraceae bacterium]|nr:YfhO family protein [Lachnospiraceae bacterium]MEE0919858.1 YfhO family protein [Lachnospiraceae bacterium]
MKLLLSKNISINTFKSKSRKFDLLYFLSFTVPFLIMLTIFAIREIYPFGEKERSFLHIDMYHQYFPFLVEFYHKLKNGESLLYSWNTGIGSNFVALYAYYLATPTNWLCLFVPEQYLMEFISYMVIVKIGLCGLSFTYYIRKHYQTNSYYILIFSVFYALSGYLAAYNWNVMWLDVIVLAPVIILGLEKLVYEGKCRLYCITLGLSILSNYYLSIMLCIFLVLYFVVLMIGKKPDEKHNSANIVFPGLNKISNYYIKAVIRFAVYSLLAGGMAAILLLPELAALKFTEFSDISFPTKIKTYFSVIDMLARHSFNVVVETGLDHWPNIYCGVMVYLLLPLYVIQKKIPLSRKAPRLLLLAFMLISYSTNVLNFIWHGLNYPDSLPARQSFLYIFLLLTMCFEEFQYIKEHSSKDLTTVLASVIGFVLLCEKLITDDSFTGICFLITGILIIIYGLLIHSYRKNSTAPKWLIIITAIIVIIESGTNTFLTSCPTVSRETYLSNYDSYEIITQRTIEKENHDFFRFEKFARRTQNDAMLIGFPAASYFSSTLNSLVSNFYETYGLKGSRVNYCFDGATPITAALLANRYMLYTINRDYDNLYELVDTEGSLYLYKNKYTLPLGYMIPSENTNDLSYNIENTEEITNSTNNYEESTDDYGLDMSIMNMFTSANDADEILENADNSKSNLNPIEQQNLLVRRLGINEDAFTPVDISVYGDEADLYIEEDAHYYAYSENKKIDNIKMKYENESKTFKQIKKKYILDLGYHTFGQQISLNSENKQDLNISAYKLNEDVLKMFIDKLSKQTMSVNHYDETSISGSINVTTPGQLVLSVPYEPGWTLTVDGVEQNIDLFEDVFISTYLDSGNHEIYLSYYPQGLNAGIILSVISILIFALIQIYISKKSDL